MPAMALELTEGNADLWDFQHPGLLALNLYQTVCTGGKDGGRGVQAESMPNVSCHNNSPGINSPLKFLMYLCKEQHSVQIAINVMLALVKSSICLATDSSASKREAQIATGARQSLQGYSALGHWFESLV